MAGVQPFRRNPHDSRAMLAQYFKPKSLVDKIFTEASVFPPDCDRLKATWIIARGDALLRRSEVPSDTAVALAIANAIARNLECMPVAEANAHVNMCMGVFLAQEMSRREYVVFDDARYALLRAPAAQGVAAGLWHGMNLPQNLADFRDHQFQLTDDDTRRIIAGVLANLSPRIEKGGAYLYTVAFLSLSKRGEITRKLNSILTQLCEELGTEIELDAALLRYVYNHVGSRIPVEHLGTMFAQWAEDRQNLSLRLRVALEQAADAGLT